jgi:hypothetical protein
MDRSFGYIEGYYGKMLSWDERRFLCDRLAQQSLNTYVYAPKEDPFHRTAWRTPYPSSWMETFRIFVRNASRENVCVVPCVAPGLTFDYTSVADYAVLLKKMSVFADIGSRTVALLMDDIPQTLPEGSRGTFASLGQAHGMLLSRLLADLRKRCPGLRLWFCPTVYADQYAPEGVSRSAYLTDLSLSIPPDVQVFWTGPAVIAARLDNKVLARISRLLSGNVVVWDNLYANDYCPNRLFAGPYAGRSRTALQAVNGILLNPTGMPHTDSLLLGVLAGFKNGLPREQAWRRAAREAEIDSAFFTVARFFAAPNSAPRCGRLTKATIARARKALHHLIWEWKSPLQREWYPYLYMLDTDLALLRTPGDSPGNRQWIARKYPPVLSAILTERAGHQKRAQG